MFSMSVCRYVSISCSHVFVYLCTEFWITWLAYLLSYDLTGSIVLTNSYKSRLSNWYTCTTKSITLSSPSLALSLKILPISKLSTRGAVSFNLICCYFSLIPPSVASVHYAVLIIFILSVSEVIPSCSYCVKKGLVYIVITSPFNY